MPNPNILFQNQPTPSLSENFESVLGTQQKLNEFRNQPIRNRLLQNQAEASDIGLQQARTEMAMQGQDQQRKAYMQQIGDMAVDALGLLPLIESGDVGQITTALDKRIEKIRARGGDPSDTMDFRDRLISGQINKDQAVQELSTVVSTAERIGAIRPDNQMNTPTAEQKNRSALLKAIRPALDENGNFDPSIANAEQRSAAMDLGLIPKTGTMTTSEREAYNPNLASTITGIVADRAGAAERAKIGSKLEKEPELEARKVQATEAAKLEAKINDKIATAGRDAAGVNSILDMAEEMIPLSTQSGIGTAADVAAGMVGVSTKGAEVADSLRALEGALIMKMPRMEGPQSNYDVELYRQMAARIGDSTVPAERRLAALKTLRELTNKYAVKSDSAPKSRVQPNQYKSASGITFTVE